MTINDLRLIVRLVRGDRAGATRYLEGRQGALDRLADAALLEGLAVGLIRALPSLPPGVEIPDRRRDALESRRRLQAGRSTAILDALASLAAIFSAASQPFLLLKGPYLAARYYGDPDGREFVDLDLLVPGADRARAWRLLETAGYRRRSRVLGGERMTSFFVHGFDFANGNASVDLHWHLMRHPSVRVDERRLWSEHDQYTVGGTPFGVLSTGHEVVFQALSLLRDIERGRPKSKNVVDLVQVVAASDDTMDWEALFERGRPGSRPPTHLGGGPRRRRGPRARRGPGPRRSAIRPCRTRRRRATPVWSPRRGETPGRPRACRPRDRSTRRRRAAPTAPADRRAGTRGARSRD